MDESSWQQLLASQDGVVSRRQAIEVGWHRAAVEHRLGRSWQRLLPAVYLTVTGTPTWQQKARAALLFGGDGAALTSFSGLFASGLADQRDDVHVAVRRTRRLRAVDFEGAPGAVLLHRTTRPIANRYGTVPTLSVARCVTDACLGLDNLSQVRALVSTAVQRGRTTVELLEAELELAPQNGSAHLRTALAEVADGARSAPEAALARALRSASLPPYRLNVDVYDENGTWLARPDLVVEELKLAVEVDGQRWHLSADRWVADVERHTRLEAAGWTVLRYPASRVLADAAGVVAEIERVARRLGLRFPA